MAILANRIKTKNHLLELVKLIFLSFKQFFLYILIFFCSLLIYFPTPGIIANISLEVSGGILQVASLFYKESSRQIKLIYDKVSYLKNLEKENIQLKLELAELKRSHKDFMSIEIENAQLRKTLNVPLSIKSNYVTAKIIGFNFTPFSSLAIVQAGVINQVKLNDVVQAEEGVIGRIINVSEHYSTVMLVNDHNSRIPVITSRSKERGVIAKQGDDLKLIYLKENHAAKVGELIYTSGDGKIYPYGLLVAKIEKINDQGVFVNMTANLNDIEFVVIESGIQEDIN